MDYKFDYMDIGKIVEIEDGPFVLKVTSGTDRGAPNPLEDMDGIGTIRSFSTHRDNSIDLDEVAEIIEDGGIAVPLSHLDQGVYVRGAAGTTGDMLDFLWDGVSDALVWLPDEYITPPKGLGESELMKWWRKRAQIACDTYNQWANGDVYWCDIELTLSIGNWKKEVYEDSCNGMYGDYIYEYLNSEILPKINKIIAGNKTVGIKELLDE